MRVSSVGWYAKTLEEAELIANEIKRAFPAYAREIRVVRDRINSRQ